jgi:HEPN domain-containing protein
MKARDDLVRGWLRKAQSDLAAVNACFAAEVLDATCFHAPQAVEKFLKAYLTYYGGTVVRIHNLAKLVELCAEVDESFRTVGRMAASLTPYAVELRYDQEFWPVRQSAEAARTAARTIADFVLSRLPETFRLTQP